MSATRIAGELQRAGVTVRAVGRPLAAPQVVTYAVEPSPATMRQALRQGARLQAALRTVDPPRIVQRGRWLLVEVPRAERRAVPLSAMRASGLAVDIGIAATGRRVTLDLSRTPHALVAGQTGSGKSVDRRLSRDVESLREKLEALEAKLGRLEQKIGRASCRERV